MGFIKYSEAKLDLVGDDMPEWVEGQDKKEASAKLKVEENEKDKKDD